MNGEAPTVGLRRGAVLFLSGGGPRAASFHLGALTRLNELGLLAGTETIRAVAGGSIVAALLAERVPWPLQGAYRDWPETVAEPLREIVRSRIGRRMPLRGLREGPGAEAALEERFARELVGAGGHRSPDGPRLVIGEPDLRWELGQRPVAGPLGEGQLGALEDHGYLTADAAVREQRRRPAALEPLPPPPPHSEWTSGREGLAAGTLRRAALRTGWAKRARRPAPPEAEELLARHRPFVQYDSLESYRADSAATIVEPVSVGRCNALHRGDGSTIAAVLPGEGMARLDLDYLGRSTYADGRAVHRDDYLDEAGGSHATDALAARRRPGCADVVYGRALRAGGRLWLQYWLFFYYNDKGFLQAWRHEGDWEAVQLRIGADGAPDAIACGRRHAGAERAAWHEVERQGATEGEAPVLYCARGSHAPLLRAGTHPAPVAPDHNDGLGPRLRPRLVPIGEDGPGWALWPGRWGSTRRREAFEGDSPRGPAEHPQWRDPEGFHREARPAAEAPRWDRPAPAAPRLSAYREGESAVLSYRFPDRAGAAAPPARIVAGAFGEDPDGVVIAHSFLVEGRGGSCVIPAPPDSPPLGIRVSVCSELGTPGPTLTVPIDR